MNGEISFAQFSAPNQLASPLLPSVVRWSYRGSGQSIKLGGGHLSWTEFIKRFGVAGRPAGQTANMHVCIDRVELDSVSAYPLVQRRRYMWNQDVELFHGLV